MIAKVVGMKIGTHIYSRKLPESIKNAIFLFLHIFFYFILFYIFILFYTTQKFQNFPGKTPISFDPLFLSMANYPKLGRSPTFSKGVVVKNSSGRT